MGVVIITTLVFGLINTPYGLSLLIASKFIGVPFYARCSIPPALHRVLHHHRRSRAFPDVVLWLPMQLLPAIGRRFPTPSGAGWICPK